MRASVRISGRGPREDRGGRNWTETEEGRYDSGPGDPAACVFCGRRNSAGARFCRRCGSRLSAAWRVPGGSASRPAPRDSLYPMLAAGLIALLVLGLLGIGWALYDPWGGGAVQVGGSAGASPAPAAVSPADPVQPAARGAAQPPRAVSHASHRAVSLSRHAFPQYGVTLYRPHGWREVSAPEMSDAVPFWRDDLDQEADLLAAYLPPSGDSAVIVLADHSPQPELSDIESRLHGEVLFRGLAGQGLPDIRLRGGQIAGRQALLSEAVVTPEAALQVAILIGPERVYCFALAARDEAALRRLRRSYWPALQRTELTPAQAE